VWVTVVFTAVVSGLDPAGVTVLVVLLSRPRPTRLLGAYFVGGFGMSLIIGVVILFALNGIGVGGGSAVPPWG
jgi:Sap, sulfolipid-1-addressing protein